MNMFMCFKTCVSFSINFYGMFMKKIKKIGPRSRQSSVEGSDPMNTEDVYRSLRRTTHEIQNYSFESKLDQNTNSKDSGISQMGDHVMHVEYSYQTNGMNGHLGLVYAYSELILFLKVRMFY